ncbi:hypothetical protein [Marinobacterium lutimaris]|uniref:Sulfotransferase family protein n=1 Tax=Marinobacterium lutimaris TaxID=568106 RepID=A0A1H6B317_9GAMM|nr:hypothetical protein [Marinobacterium lutimaris]SEG55012.1 hypothetical protein SAMN05444390_102356 [Marinobacterium lutimaris]
MKRKLIIHVGMGKTGSSSIQKTLRVARPTLEQHGIKYLGLMLEHLSLPVAQYDWHVVDGWERYTCMDRAQANRELAHVLQYAADKLPPDLHTLIWSNESLFDCIENVEPALNALRDRYDIQIIGYIRRPDSWILSAYLQWGIKHKINSGPIQPFRNWVRRKPYVVTPKLEGWSSFADEACFYNFDDIQDVSAHFVANVLSLKTGDIPSLRENDTPPPAAMALFAYHNSMAEGAILPDELEPLLKEAGLYEKMQKSQPYNKLLPVESDVASYVEQCQGEVDKINKIFEASGQARFDLTTLKYKDYSSTPLDTNRALFKVIYHLYKEIELLKSKMNED